MLPYAGATAPDAALQVFGIVALVLGVVVGAAGTIVNLAFFGMYRAKRAQMKTSPRPLVLPRFR